MRIQTLVEQLAEQLQGAALPTKVAAGLGAVAALLAVLLFLTVIFGARSSTVRRLCTLSLLLAVAAVGTALFAFHSQRQRAARVTDGLRPAQAERAKRSAYEASVKSLTLALPLTAAPLLLALLGLRVASRRRWSEYHEIPPPSPAFPLLLLAVGAAGWGYGARIYQQPIPGRALAPESWAALDFVDALDANEWEKCLAHEAVVPPDAEAIALSSDRDSQRRCAEYYLKAPATEANARENLEKLLAASWPNDPAVKDRLKERLAELKPPTTLAAALPMPPAPQTTKRAPHRPSKRRR